VKTLDRAASSLRDKYIGVRPCRPLRGRLIPRSLEEVYSTGEVLWVLCEAPAKPRQWFLAKCMGIDDAAGELLTVQPDGTKHWWPAEAVHRPLQAGAPISERDCVVAYRDNLMGWEFGRYDVAVDREAAFRDLERRALA